MAFRFPLQAVLRLRRSLENQEEKKLMAIVSDANRMRQEIQQLDSAGILQRRAENEELASGASVGAMLQFYAAGEERRRDKRAQCEKKLAQVEEKRRVQIEEYRKARRNREILESLRDSQKAQYEMERSKREQESLDEVFLARSMREERE